MTSPPKVLAERREHIVVLTLNRPAARNAVDGELADLLGGHLHDADRDPGVRAVILTSSDSRSFCAGADLKAVTRGESIAPSRREWGFAGWVRHEVSVPTIAAVEGSALGGGTELALACDLVVAGADATFGLPEVRRGLLAAAGGVIRLPLRIPPAVAMEMLLTGRPIDAGRALAVHLINRLAPVGGALGAALELAAEIAEAAPLAARASKRLARGVIEASFDEQWARCDAQVRALMASEDAREGPRAFAEKRAPQWRGR